MSRITMDTLTWRALLAGKVSRAVKVPRNGQAMPCRRGDRIPVMRPPGGRAVGRVHILATPVLQPLEQLVPAGDVRAAMQHGAPTTTEFYRRFLAMHDQRVRRLTPDEVVELDGDQIAEFWQRWLQREVWALAVTLEREQHDRFLARTSKATGHKLVDEAGFALRLDGRDDAARGYTRDPRLALGDEGAAVDDVALAVFADEARARDRMRAKEAAAEVRAALDRLDALAAERGVVLHRDRRVIEDRLDKVERRFAA